MTWLALFTAIYLLIDFSRRPWKRDEPLSGVLLLVSLTVGTLWIVAWQQRWAW